MATLSVRPSVRPSIRLSLVPETCFVLHVVNCVESCHQSHRTNCARLLCLQSHAHVSSVDLSRKPTTFFLPAELASS